MLIFAEMASAEMRKTKARIVLDADITIETRLHHKSQRLRASYWCQISIDSPPRGLKHPKAIITDPFVAG
jgi:hypothetical protein